MKLQEIEYHIYIYVRYIEHTSVDFIKVMKYSEVILFSQKSFRNSFLSVTNIVFKLYL